MIINLIFALVAIKIYIIRAIFSRDHIIINHTINLKYCFFQIQYYFLDTSNAGSNLSSNTTGRIKQNVADALFTARIFLPGFFEKNVFLILNLILPLVDFSTDAINAGNGLHTKLYISPD